MEPRKGKTYGIAARHSSLVHLIGLQRPEVDPLERRLAFAGPNSPVIIEPLADGQVVSNFDVHMEVDPAAYVDADGNAHQSTSWQIRETATAGGAVVWQAPGVSDPLSKVHIHLGDGAFVGTLAGQSALLPNHDYVLRATFTDARGETSATSTRSFHTAAETAPVPGEGTWIVQEGYAVELAAPAGAFRLPVNVAFVPNPGPNPTDPLYYVTELYGSIKVVTRAGQVSDYATGLLDYNPSGPISGTGEQGLAGIAVDPASGDLFVGMLWNNGVSDAARGSATLHFPKVERLHSTDGGRTMATRTLLLNMQPETQGQSHQISNISIGPDGKLYVHMGDGFTAATALNLDAYRGKVLRMNLDGTAATDNPFYNAGNGINARDYVYTYGHRNPFGGAWRASTGVHYVVENGNGLDRMVNIARGQSYGWDGNDSTLVANSIYVWNPATAPVNIAFVQPQTFGGSLFPASSQDDAFVSLSGPTYAAGPQAQGKRIERFNNVDTLNGSGKLATAPSTLLRYNGTGRASISALAAGPDGLYFADLYRDDGTGGATAAGADVYRVRYVDFHPTGVIATPGNGQVFVNWTGDALAATHNLYRRSGGAPFTLLQSGVSGTTFTDTTAANGTTYRYVVRGVNAGGESSDSNEAVATPAAPPDQPPTIAAPAAAAQNPVLGASLGLNVLGADDGGEANLVYTWAVQGTPPGAVSFCDNGTNTAKNTTATFAAPGIYDLVVTVRDGLGQTVQSPVTVTVSAASPGTGNGLTAVYFNNADVTGTSLVRTDPTIDFDFAPGGSPDPFIAADTFSARWLGFVEPLFTETYTFTTTSDDGVRLWVDNLPLIDQWSDHTAAAHAATTSLVAGARHAIRLEYYQNTGAGAIELAWQSASQPPETVPQSRLYSSAPIRVNFQPRKATIPVPPGYLADRGDTFADRGNGHAYGWTRRNRAGRDRNSVLSPDQRYDTWLKLRRKAAWEIALPNGTYRVHVASGDAKMVRGALRADVEGTPVLNGTVSTGQRWLEGWVDVTVTDGRLTVTAPPGYRKGRVNFIDIIPLG